MLRFNEEWTSKYVTTSVASEAVGLISHESVQGVFNIKRYFSTKHANYVAKPPECFMKQSTVQ